MRSDSMRMGIRGSAGASPSRVNAQAAGNSTFRRSSFRGLRDSVVRITRRRGVRGGVG